MPVMAATAVLVVMEQRAGKASLAWTVVTAPVQESTGATVKVAVQVALAVRAARVARLEQRVVRPGGLASVVMAEQAEPAERLVQAVTAAMAATAMQRLPTAAMAATAVMRA